MKKIFGSIVLVALMSMGSPAHAEFLGMLNGRSADLTKLSDLSVEGGFITGDDYDHFGVRVNYRVSPGMIVYGDLGKSDFAFGDATPLGVGLYYQLQDLISSADTAIKGSYHSGKLKYRSFSTSLSAISIELIASGREPLSDNGLEWYGQLGFNRLKGEGGSDTELGIGGGLILPVGAGEAYFGIEHIDDLFFGVGFRYNL